MKILYAIQGTGNGHITRAKEIIPMLQKKGEVDILISGVFCEITLPYPVKYKLYGLGFTFGKKGGIDFWDSIKRMKLRTLFNEIKNLPIQQYDLVINDFEPVSAWAAKLKNVNIISLSHQNAVSNPVTPKYGISFVQKHILKYYAPAKHTFGFHFKSYDSSIFTPIIRRKVRTQNVINASHYTVYLPAYSDKKIIKILSEFKHIKWEVFSKTTQSYQYKNNITIRPIDENDFIKSLASCTGVLCGAGFETPSEALFLNKKLLVIPMKNQYEQQCNAAALKEMGVSVLSKLSKNKSAKIKKWIASDTVVTMDYPDITFEILEAILLPFYPQEIIPTTV